MKRLFISLIIAFATICGFAQDAESSKVDFYEIKGILKNVPDGTVLQLFAFEGHPPDSSTMTVMNSYELLEILACVALYLESYLLPLLTRPTYTQRECVSLPDP